MAVGSNILIVDDNPMDLTEVLPMYGYDIETVEDGQEAIDKLSRSERKYDLVLLNDAALNAMGTLKTIRNDSRFATIPIMMFTGENEDNRQVTSLRIGADDCLSLPYALPNLLARIEALLRRASWQKSQTSQIASSQYSREQIKKTVRLTQRELEVLKLVAIGESNSAIAQKLFLKEVTVKTHLNNIFKKFKVQNRMQAVLAAKKMNIIDG